MSTRDLECVLNPGSVAVIGASASPGKWGHAVLKGIVEGGYRGRVYPINPTAREILGLRAYRSILEVEGAVELAVIGIRAELIPKAVVECQQKGVKAVMIISGGFAETGPEGKQLEDEVVRLAGSMRVVGPNMPGLADLSHSFNATFFRPLKGSLVLISQSGNIINEVEYLTRERGLGFSRVLNPGNQADVTICDFIEYLRDKPDAEMFLMYLEGFKEGEGRRFVELVRGMVRDKPVIAIKVGMTKAGVRAARSHTAQMAGENAIWDAALRQVGVIRVSDAFELVDVSEALLRLPPLRGNRIGVLVDGGGHSTLGSDAATRYGLELATLSAQTQERLKGVLLPHAIRSNPVDFTGGLDADPTALPRAAGVILEDCGVDGLLVLGINFGGYARWFGTADLEAQSARDFAALVKRQNKPVVFHNTVLSEDPPALKILREQGVPVYRSAERAARCMAALMARGRHLSEAGG